MMQKVQLTSDGIKKHLNSTTPAQSITEYVWNSLDARAKKVDINFEKNEIENIVSITISDDGDGIEYEQLETKFGVFLDSEKKKSRQDAKRISSDLHGKDGIGRLTFFSFARRAEWTTTYEKDGKKFQYKINIDSSDLVNYPATELREVDVRQPKGTTVVFLDIDSSIIRHDDVEFRKFIICEFCWKLLLSSEIEISLQGEKILAESNIAEEIFYCPINTDAPTATVRIIRWNEKLHREFSRYYFLDSKNTEHLTDFTSLNKKGDGFFHSAYIQSVFFDNFILTTETANQDSLNLGENSIKSEWFKTIKKIADEELRKCRKAFLKETKEKIIDSFVEKNIFPSFNNKNKWEIIRHQQLTETVGELYNIQPTLFTAGSLDQKKILVRLIDQLLENSESDSLYKIIGHVLELDQKEKNDLLDVLKTSKLNSIVKSIKLIQDRYRVLEQIKILNWNVDLDAKEVPHIQALMESHYWVIGEEYSLVVAAEKDFEQALRELYKKIDVKLESDEIDHVDKNKEMDILLVRQNIHNNKIHNVVMELKHPKRRLGKKYVRQIETYFELIFSEPRFNAPNMEWSYYLIGNKYDTTGFIEAQMENAKTHNEPSLIFKAKNHKIYVKLWSELINEVELKHNFLNKQLEVQREILAEEENIVKTADEVIVRAKSLTCATP